jgi:hypothetical protein
VVKNPPIVIRVLSDVASLGTRATIPFSLFVCLVCFVVKNPCPGSELQIQRPRAVTVAATIPASRPFAVKTPIRILQEVAEVAEVAENTSCLSAFVVNQIRATSRRFAGNLPFLLSRF